MIMGFQFAFELVDNFVFLKDFVIEIYIYVTLGYVLFVVFVRFVYMVRKDLVGK